MKQESTWSYMVYIDQALAPQKGISMREREREHWLKATGNVSIPGANSFLSLGGPRSAQWTVQLGKQAVKLFCTYCRSEARDSPLNSDLGIGMGY